MSQQAVFCLNQFSTPILARTNSFCAYQPHEHLSIMDDTSPSVSGNPSGETSNKRKGKGRKPVLPNYQNDKLIPIIERILPNGSEAWRLVLPTRKSLVRKLFVPK